MLCHSFTRMLQLYASSAKKIAFYFKNPSTLYEHYINTTWVVHKNVFQSKQPFTKATIEIEAWSDLTDEKCLKTFSQKAVPQVFCIQQENISDFRRSFKR